MSRFFSRKALHIASTWNGLTIAPREITTIVLQLSKSELTISVEGPFWNDAQPQTPAGSTPNLWDYEVVELFLLGDNEQYLEVELGPHGHYLVLELLGRRNPVRQGMAISYHAQIQGDRWSGQARIPQAWLPKNLSRLNAYSIHGDLKHRQYLAWQPPMGDAPDFHQLECFGSLLQASDV